MMTEVSVYILHFRNPSPPPPGFLPHDKETQGETNSMVVLQRGRAKPVPVTYYPNYSSLHLPTRGG
jgi:hypothetical protein